MRDVHSHDETAEHGVPTEVASTVRTELDTVLSTERFVRSPRSSAILRFIVEEALEGRQYQINSRTIARNAFEADQDEESLSDAAVRVAVGRLRNALVSHYQERPSAEVEISIPTGSYVPHFARQIDSHPSVAVIVFDDLGVNTAHGHVRYGLAEAIAARLAVGTSFEVVGAIDPELNSPSDRRSDLIGGFDYVISGTIRPVGEMVRVDVKLSARGGGLLWSLSSEGRPDSVDLVAFERDIVLRTVGEVGDYTGIINRHRAAHGSFSDEPVVHKAWSRYFAYMHLPHDELLWEALAAMEHATTARPQARVQGVLAHLHTSAAVVEPDEADTHLRLASELSRAALAEVPDDPHARLALGVVELLRGHHELARREFGLIPALPAANPSLLYGAGIGTIATGAWADGVDMIERAIQRNPGHYGFWMLYPAFERYRRGDYDAALEAARVVHLPSDPIGGILRAAILVRLDRIGPATTALREEDIENEPDLAAAMIALRRRLLVPPQIADDLERDAMAVLAT